MSKFKHPITKMSEPELRETEVWAIDHLEWVLLTLRELSTERDRRANTNQLALLDAPATIEKKGGEP